MTRPPELGGYFLKAQQPGLSSEEQSVVDRSHDLYYRRWQAGADTINLSWMGHRVLKCPLDLWIYQELITQNRPDVIIETGTAYGGSALFMASICELLGHGEVITIDIQSDPSRPEHPRMAYVHGSSTAADIVAEVLGRVAGKRVMVVLDSDHTAGHVYDEMVAYSGVVGESDYLIVEDTNINGHPTYPEFGPGPMEAVARFLAESPEFEVDRRCERFLMTLNPGGFLRRVRSAAGS